MNTSLRSRHESAGTAYLVARPDAAARLRLFCFHHAGGGASVFADWQLALGNAVAVLPVQLPGRERRVREPRVTDMAVLVEELDRHLDPFLQVPYVFYGHSMGALIAYNLSLSRVNNGRPPPLAFLVGACVPPHLPQVSETTRQMSDDQLVQWLVDLGGMSGMVLKYREWVEAATSLLRDDLNLCHSHLYSGSPPLPFPIHAFAGEADPIVPAEVMAGWASHTQRECKLYGLPGGHLFIRDSASLFLGTLASVLAEVQEGAQRP